MTLAPRFLVKLWTRLRLARFSRRLKAPGGAVRAQQETFARLMAAAAATAQGRALGLGPATTYEQFRDKVPPHGYDRFQPLIARMAAGEADVLVPGRCQLFVETAGTAGAESKVLPAPEAMLTHYQAGLRDALLHYARRAGHAGVFLGRQVQTGASTALTEKSGARYTSLDGILARCLSPWVEANLHSPPAAIAQMPEGAAKTGAIAAATRRSNVTVIGGTHALLHALALRFALLLAPCIAE